MKLALLLGVLVVTAPQQRAPDARVVGSSQVRGVIRYVEDGQRVPVPFALVEVVGPPRRRATMADSAGGYRLDGIPPGLHRIRARHVGYEPLDVEVMVPAGDTVDVDLVLRSRAVALPALRVAVGPLEIADPDRRDATPHTPGAGLVALRALEASPGLVESGVGEAVRSAPGNERRDPTDVLLMRGSTADLKLVLLDGAPVYAPFHTGGLLQGFQVSTLGAAAHHVGGAPARYDGGLSYILDLRTRPARRDRPRASGTVDLVSVQGGIESPLGSRGGVLATGRALHGAGGRLAGGDGSPYGYVDGLVRADADVGPDAHLSVTGFANREAVRLDMPAAGTTPDLDEASWGNHALSARWRSPVGTAHLDLGVATTSYRAELPVTLRSTDPESFETTSSVHVASGTTDRTRLTADLTLPDVAGGLRVGASLDRTGVAYGTRSVGSVPSTVRSRGSVVGAYLDGTRPLSGELDLRYGARLDRFDPGGVKGALRLAMLWSLGPDALLTVAGGRYHQLVRLGDTEADLALGDALEVGTVPEAGSVSTGLLRAATADHLTLSLDQEVTPRVRLAFEGFLKRFRGLGSSAGSELASSGADLRIVSEGEGTTAWLGYSLAWFWEVGAESSEFSGRHLLSAGLQGALAGPVGVDLRAAFSDGLPLTAVAIDPSRAAQENDPSQPLTGEGTPDVVRPGRTDGFLRIDAEVFAEWTREWGGRTVHLRPYLKVLNALDRRDALFYYFEPWRGDGLRPIAELSLIPVAGLEWRF